MLVPLLGAALVAAGFLVVLERCTKRSPTGTGIVLAATVVLLLLDVRAPMITIAGANIIPFDGIAVLIAGAAAARLLRTRRLSPEQVLLLVVSATLLLSLARGVAEHGLQPATNEFRLALYFFSVTLYAASIPRTGRVTARLQHQWRIAGAALIALVWLRWLALAAGLTSSGSVLVRAEEGGIRVIPAGATILLVYVLFMVLPAWRHPGGSRADRWLAIACFLTIVGLQHRTLLLALGVGVAVMVLRDQALRRRFGPRLAVVVALSLMVLAWLPTTETLPHEFGDLNTLQWRIEGWMQLVAQQEPTVTSVLIGHPFGGGYERTVAGSTFDVLPHNYFLETYLRGGLVGLLALLGVYAVSIRALLPRRGPETDSEADVTLALLITQLLYFAAWSPAGADGLVAGAAFAQAEEARRAAREARSRPPEPRRGPFPATALRPRRPDDQEGS